MTVLAAALTEAMTSSRHDLVLLNRENNAWIRHPWPEVLARAQNVAEWLLDSGRSGAVALVGEPTVEFVATVCGTWLAGQTISILPGPVRGADVELWAQTTLTRCAALGVSTVMSHGAHLGLLQLVETPLAIADLTPIGHARRSRPWASIATAAAAPAVMQGTAGSTGTPRVALLAPDAVVHNVRGLITHTQVDPSTDVGCSWLPLYHDMGLTFLLSAALAGSTMWLAPTAAFSASPFRWLTWLSESSATMTAAPNFAYTVLGRFSRRAPQVDLSHVRYAINGGEPIDCAGFHRFATEFSRLGFAANAGAPSYGLAEATCAVTAPLPGTGLLCDEVTRVGGGSSLRRYALLGRPIPGMEIRVAEPRAHYNDIPGREVGEIEVRGTSLMTGYVGENALGRSDWFSTGDLGYFRDDSLVVCGRAKEVISVAGRNVFPTEVETVAAQVNGVRAGAVVAVGINVASSRPELVIAAEFAGPDEPGTRAELMRRVTGECGIVPSRVVLLAPGSLPRTTSGKLRRLEIRELMEGAAS